MTPDAVHKLPDLLAPGLRLVICGSAAGAKSAAVGAYYAGPGNKFWRILHETGLTPRRFEPQEYPALLALGLGLTDLAKTYSGADAGLRREHDDVAGLVAKIERFQPAWLAFNGRRAARAVLGRAVAFGPQPENIGATRLFALPSTAGLASRWWDPAPWRELAGLVRPCP
jgi:TDG/mug DNA glycosylase family protein